MMAMEFTAVESTQISHIGYDEETLEAQVEFSNGSVYRYTGVPKEVIESTPEAQDERSIKL
jgi:hypothetical protein